MGPRIFAMLDYIANRLAERSTWEGIAFIAALTGSRYANMDWGQCAALGATISGAIKICFPDHQSTKGTTNMTTVNLSLAATAVTPNSPIILSVGATSLAGIQFSLGAGIAPQTIAGPAPYSAVFANVPAGTYDAVAQPIDNLGNLVGTQVSVNVIVSAATAGPTVNGDNPIGPLVATLS